MYLVIVTVRDWDWCDGSHFVVIQVARFRIFDVEASTGDITSTGE